MYFANRPELRLPSAPDTLWFAAVRALLWCFGVAIVVSISSSIALASALPDRYFGNLILALAAVAAWLFAILVHVFVRDRYERRYWTAERVAQRCPYLWQLYLVGNTASVSRDSTRWGSFS